MVTTASVASNSPLALATSGGSGLASAGLAAVGRHRLPIGVRVQTLFDASLKVGAMVRKLRTPAPPREKGRLPEPSTEETGS